ncbi:MAG: NAD-dependent epimerase/dehydratase family protein [Chitinophagales bacterium]|nr:NAD-dependent epimerase/dehydratase family protein [Chitinophagales bacterium]
MRRILITGVGGFIGSNLAENLVTDNNLVIGVDNFSNYPKTIHSLYLSPLLKLNNFIFKNINILDSNKLLRISKKYQPDWLIHCAAKTGVRQSMVNINAYYRTNVIGSLSVLEIVRLINKKTKVILFSSSSVYGFQKSRILNEKLKPNPLNHYGYSKLLSEQIAQYYAKTFNIPLIILRPFSVYGPRPRLDMAPFLAIKAAEQSKPFYKYGSNTNNFRDWTYIDDLIKVVNILLNKPLKSYQIFNVSSASPLGIDDFLTILKNELHSKLNLKLCIKKKKSLTYEMKIAISDNSKLRNYIGVYPTTTFQIGVINLLKYYQQHRKIYRSLR